MTAIDQFKQHFKPGAVYRRADVEQWTNAVDRHLYQLMANGVLMKLAPGLYYRPKMTVFGPSPVEDEVLVKAFLKDDRFLLTSPNLYNALKLGTTQLYNETVVYNRKRHGHFKIGGRTFRFAVKPYFPRKITPEFLLIDLVNNLHQLAENRDCLLEQVRKKAASMDQQTLTQVVQNYGSVRTKKFFKFLKDNKS